MRRRTQGIVGAPAPLTWEVLVLRYYNCGSTLEITEWPLLSGSEAACLLLFSSGWLRTHSAIHAGLKLRAICCLGLLNSGIIVIPNKPKVQFVCMCIHIHVCAGTHTCVCTWRLEVDVDCLSQSSCTVFVVLFVCVGGGGLIM